MMIPRFRIVSYAAAAAVLIALAAPQFAHAQTNGMTWSVLQTNPTDGTSRVGCKVGCDPYKGDTPCTTPLPLLGEE